MTPDSDRRLRKSVSFAAGFLVIAASVSASALSVRSVRVRIAELLGPKNPSYAVGDVIDSPSERLRSPGRTLLVFARSSCAACEHAVPTLRRLTEAAKEWDQHELLIATEPASDAQRRFAASIGFGEDNVVLQASSNGQFQGLRVVPTVLVVDHFGRILALSEGGLDDANMVQLDLVLGALRSR